MNIVGTGTISCYREEDVQKVVSLNTRNQIESIHKMYQSLDKGTVVSGEVASAFTALLAEFKDSFKETNTELIVALRDLRIKILDQGIDVAANLIPLLDNVVVALKR